MKLNELQGPRGTYAAVRVLEPSNSLISDFIQQNSIPVTSLKKEKRKHVTLLYSRVHLPEFVADASIIHNAKVVAFDLFDFNPGVNAKKCLVMKLSAPTLVARWTQLMAEHPATYDFPTYQPHITLSYDVPHDFDIGSLPMFQEEVMLGEEYSEELELS